MLIRFFQGFRGGGVCFFASLRRCMRLFPEKKAKAGTKKTFPLAKRALTRYIMLQRASELRQEGNL
jgi:hypothetical protein